MQGVNAEVKNIFYKGAADHIMRSRVIEGGEHLREATPEETVDVLRRWNALRQELKGFQTWKVKEAKDQSASSPHEAGGSAEPPKTPPKTGWRHTRHLSFGERKKLHAKRDALQRSQPSSGQSDGQADPTKLDQPLDEDFERAIQASVQETSKGNAEEDAAVEQAMRMSLQQMRNRGQPLPTTKFAPAEDRKDSRDDLEITDEEYQQLIEHAIQQSLALEAAETVPETGSGSDDQEYRTAVEESKKAPPLPPRSDDEAYRRAIEESKQHHAQHQSRGQVDIDDDELRRAIEESRSAHADHQQRGQAAKTEEEIVMEYVKRQSLAEEEWRKQNAKGKTASRGDGHDEEDDEDLKRALEESLKLDGQDGAGPSSST
jgi:hypothetical protein